MPKSEAFARIHAQVMQVARAIPAGKVSTFAAIGEFLDVVPRQVAFLLARRNDPEREATPWHRVVADDGALGRPKYDGWGTSQRALLEDEGVTVGDDGKVEHLRARFFAPTRRNTGVTPTPRPATGTAKRRT